MNEPGLAAQLSSGLLQLGLAVPAAQQASLLAYLELLASWNRRFNLTAIRAPSEMVNQHLLDALVALPHVTRGPVLDVGSGAGLPGLPLAITRPGLHFTLLDSNGKKVRFIKQVVITLRLENVDVVQSRVENYQAAQPFALIVSRAFASLETLVRGSRHLLAGNGSAGEWLVWKGDLANDELDALAGLAQVSERIPVRLPGVETRRQLVRLTPSPTTT